ncbi:MAG: carboxypeptidase-like regulatory domain-containing protein, partial [Raineya sp.]
SEDTETKAPGKVEKRDKTMEQDKIAEIYTQDKMIENARQEGGAVQTEKSQNSSTENEQTDKKQKTKKYATAPQENRALNIAKDEAYQSTNIILQGQVVDAQTKKGLKNTKISLKEYPQTTQTDSLGNFSFHVPVRTKYILIVEMPDYQILETEAKPHQKNMFFLKNKGK